MLEIRLETWYIYHVVHLRVFSLNTPLSSNSSPLQIILNDVLLEDIKTDLIILDNIMKGQKKEVGIIREIYQKNDLLKAS